MSKSYCVSGCPPGETYFSFPSKENDDERRKIWMDFFNVENRNKTHLYACERHFSYKQIPGGKMKPEGIPDVPTDVVKKYLKLSRDAKNYTTTMSCTTSVCSTQTNIYLCGLVQVSEHSNEYRLNCFYCSATFFLERWFEFKDHLKSKHFDEEQAFNLTKFPNNDHDYTIVGSRDITPEPIELPKIEPPESPIPTNVSQPSETPPTSLVKLEENNGKTLDHNMAEKLIKLLDETLLNPNFKAMQVEKEHDPLALNINNNIHIQQVGVIKKSLPTKNIQQKCIKENTNLTIRSTPMRINYKKCVPYESSPKSRIVLNSARTSSTQNFPAAYTSEEESSNEFNNDETSLKKEIHIESAQRTVFNFSDEEFDKDTENQSSSKCRLYRGNKTNEMDANESTPEFEEFEEETENPSSSKCRLYRGHETNAMDTNESTSESEEFDKETKNQSSSEYRLYGDHESTSETSKLNPTELVFEFTSRDIIMDLLNNIKNYPVLWKFHKEPNNEDYADAIQELCAKLNNKWSLRLNLLQMRFSINRILMYYRYMLSYEKVEIFKEYYEKCMEFLPISEDDIPRKRCKYCDICCETDSGMRKHMVREHKALKWDYKCEHCSERFREHDDFELHTNLPHYKETFRCKKCSLRLTTPQSFKKHLKLHEPPDPKKLERLYKCKVCDKAFVHRGHLSSHEPLHGEKQFSCHLCSKSFYRKMTLKIHIQRHLKIYDCVCELCGKGFINQHHLKYHMEIHTGEKITCNICNLKMKRKSLWRHLRLIHHAYEGSIETTIRAKSYHYKKFIPSTSDSFRPYKKRKVSGPRQYVCKECNIAFDRLKLLKDHNKDQHSNVKMFACKICSAELKYRPNLKRHYTEKHKIPIEQITKIVDLDMNPDEVLNLNEYL